MDARRRRALAFALVALAATPALTGCLGSGRDPLIVAASAPKAASGMTLFVVTDGFVERLSSTRAEYAIYYGDAVVYPPGGRGADFEIKERTGTVFVPYNHFVVGNGDYDVVVKYSNGEARARVNIQKWADYVFLQPFERRHAIEVQIALSSATGGHPADRILAEGDLVVEIRYRGLKGEENRVLSSVTAVTRHDQTSTMVEIPRSRLNAGPGYYSFEPLFHNSEARNNLQVGPDPTMGNRNPPWNWVYVR